MVDKKYYLVNTNGLFTEQKLTQSSNGVKYYVWHFYKKNPEDESKPLMDLQIASFNLLIVGPKLFLVKVDVNDYTTITRYQFSTNPDNAREVTFQW